MEEFIYPGKQYDDQVLKIEIAGVTHPDKSYRIHREHSELWVFEYVITGKGYIEHEQKIKTVQKGDFYLLQEGVTCTYYADKKTPYEKIWVNVRGQLIRQLMKAYGITEEVLILPLDMEPQLNAVHRVLGKQGSAEETQRRLALIFHEMVVQIYQRMQKKGGESVNLASKIRDYMEEHICEDISLSEISNRFFICKAQIIRVFKKEYGTTPYAYLLEQRIGLAKNLLKNTTMSIGEISQKLYFADEHYFSNVFRKNTGVTPSWYRKHGVGQSEANGRKN